MSWFKTISREGASSPLPEESKEKKPWFTTIDTSTPVGEPETDVTLVEGDVPTEEKPQRPRFETVYTRDDVQKPE